jgi:predicted nuclease of predicted toxin-antitoxin system
LVIGDWVIARMGTLASELGAHAGRIAGQPRIYVDANVPAGLVTFMRATLQWDVLFVIEHDDLRRARDGEHYRLARQLRRTLITLDRDYLDDEEFPPGESGGVLVLTAPELGGLIMVLRRLDEEIFRGAAEGLPLGCPPLEGRKLHVHVDGTVE